MIMKKVKIGMPKLVGSLLVAGLTVLSLSAFGQQKTTLKGEVLDMSCYMGHGSHGPGHQMCAQMCLSKGLPAGLLTSNGQVYLLVEDHHQAGAYETAIKHAADNVTINGSVVDKNGVRALIVEGVKVGG